MELWDEKFAELVDLLKQRMLALDLADGCDNPDVQAMLDLYARHLKRLMAEIKAGVSVDDEAISCWLDRRVKQGEDRQLLWECLAIDFLRGG